MKLLIVCLFACATAQVSFAQDTTFKKLNDLMEAYLQLGKFNGSALVSMNGKILLEKGYGFKNFHDSTLNDANTIFQIASMTKQFTATLILKFVELKKLSLADKLAKFYPGLPNADSITIENLLTHTSGITDHTNDTSMLPYKSSDEEKLLVSLKKYPLDFSPGSNWQYSNKGYQLLGYIIQKVSGLSYYEAIRKYIFIPLKMNSSAFDFIHLVSKDKSTGYWSFPANSKVEPATIIDSSGPFSAGAIYSTVKDLEKWHSALQSYSIVSRASLEKAYTPFFRNYGYGWMIDSLFGKRIIHHGGDIWGFKSDIARNTEDDVCIVLLNNIEDPDLGIITMKLLSILYKQPYTLPTKNKIVLSNDILRKYTGSYEMQPGMIIEITLEDGHLMATTDHKEEIYAQRVDHFMIDNGDKQMEIEFERNELGEVGGLSFFKQGKKIVCKKIK